MESWRNMRNILLWFVSFPIKMTVVGASMEMTRVLFFWEMANTFLQATSATDVHKLSSQASPSIVNHSSTSSPCLIWLDYSSGKMHQVFSKKNEQDFWANLLMQNSDLNFWMKTAENEQLYLMQIKKMAKEMPTNYTMECPPMWEVQLEDKLNYLKYVMTSVNTSTLFRKYLDPIVYTLVATLGLFGNGAMLLIMATNSEMRKGSNLLLMNLMIGDMLNLAVNLPLFYVRHQISIDEIPCHIFAILRAMFVASSAHSVAVLSLQRYRASINWSVVQSYECFYIPAVWFTSLVTAIPYSFAIQYESGNCFRCRDQHVSVLIASLEYFLYCILLPVLVTVLLCLAAHNIKDSIPDNPYFHLQKKRSRSANILICLIAIFLISYCPHHTWKLIFYWFQLDIWDYRCRCIDKITYYLLFANPCFNPFALIVMSNNFRKYISISFSACCSKLRFISNCKT